MPSTGGAREISQESLDAIVVKLRTDSSKGLSSSEAERRLKEFGPNALSTGKNYGFAGILLKELREPMILLLVVVAAIYSVLGELRDSVVIVSIVFIVVFIESYNVNRAKRSITALRKLAAPHGMVYRDARTPVRADMVFPKGVCISSASSTSCEIFPSSVPFPLKVHSGQILSISSLPLKMKVLYWNRCAI